MAFDIALNRKKGDGIGMNIAIWGIKKAGQNLLSLMNETEQCRIACFVDNNIKETECTIYNKPVVSFEELKSEYYSFVDTIIICARNSDSIESIIRQIRYEWHGRIGVANLAYLDYGRKYNPFDDLKSVFWIDKLEKPVFWYLQAVLTKRCNMDCKGCSHFANIYNSDVGNTYQLDQFIKDINHISKGTYVVRFRLLGGEPLLLENLDQYITVSREKFQDADIRIVTNGVKFITISSSILRSIKDHSIGVEISPYPTTLRAIDRIQEVLNCYDIPFSYNGYDVKENRIDTFAKNIDLMGNSNKYQAMKKCFSRGCRTIFNGKLYKCPVDMYLPDFTNYFNLQKDMHDSGYTIEEVSNNWRDMIDRLYNLPVDNCCYCSETIETFKWTQAHNPEYMDWII